MPWKRLSTPKIFGGMGFKRFKEFNMVMVGKQIWKLVSNLNSLITQVLNAKYFPQGDYYGLL